MYKLALTYRKVYLIFFFLFSFFSSTSKYIYPDRPLILIYINNTQLVSDCSKVHCLNFVARYRYDVKLKAFTKSFRNIYSTVMLAQIARDQKENRRSQILLAYNNPAQSHKILSIVDIY